MTPARTAGSQTSERYPPVVSPLAKTCHPGIAAAPRRHRGSTAEVPRHCALASWGLWGQLLRRHPGGMSATGQATIDSFDVDDCIWCPPRGPIASHALGKALVFFLGRKRRSTGAERPPERRDPPNGKRFTYQITSSNQFTDAP